MAKNRRKTPIRLIIRILDFIQILEKWIFKTDILNDVVVFFGLFVVIDILEGSSYKNIRREN